MNNKVPIKQYLVIFFFLNVILTVPTPKFRKTGNTNAQIEDFGRDVRKMKPAFQILQEFLWPLFWAK